MKGVERSTFCLANASDRSLPFAPVRRNAPAAGVSAHVSERERTRAKPNLAILAADSGVIRTGRACLRCAAPLDRTFRLDGEYADGRGRSARGCGLRPGQPRRARRAARRARASVSQRDSPASLGRSGGGRAVDLDRARAGLYPRNSTSVPSRSSGSPGRRSAARRPPYRSVTTWRGRCRPA